ncbi:TonB-dependent receptor [Novosphingobium sp. Rr 2-17]|uniref:TonB-dependent receptor n=1 Tax=Novosphingobium sp. Rr 2-17 TaxID=555793 RepID=UPI00030F7A1B|nr:TonB-dependent receptor [Novosphingobium sp. Rr 2-17]
MSASLAGCCLAPPAFAQEKPVADAGTTVVDTGQIQDIIVTAERRTSTAQKTAAAVSTRDGEDLTKQGRYALSQILENVPGISGGAAENTNGAITGGTDNPATGLTIRGIQANAGTGGSVTSTPATAAIYTDGVYNGIGSSYDIERIEVLRGPQGTLYGRSATSGVVAIHTRNPDLNDLGGDLLAHVGSYDLTQFSGALNIPLIEDKLAIRVSGNRYERDGYDSAVGGYRKTTEGRIKLLYKPTETFSALLGFAVQYNQANSGGVSITQQPVNHYEAITDDDIGHGKNHFYQWWGEFNLDLGGVKLTYVPAYKTWNATNLGIARGTPPEFDQTIVTPIDNFLTQELRLGSQDGGKLTWQTGLFYYYNNLHDSNQLVLSPSGIQAFRSETHKRTNNVGVFGEATYAIADSTRLTAGLRYDYTRVRTEQDYTSITGETKSLVGDQGLRTFKNVTYKARIEHDLTPANMLYASISSGFSPGEVAVTTDVTLAPVVVKLDSQTLTAYEIGSKNRFLGNRLQVNGAVYYNDYGGYQTAGINVTPDTPETPTFNTIVAPVRVYGAELEMLAKPWVNGQIGVNLAYTHARYHDIPEAYAELFSNNVISGTIPFVGNAWIEHRVELGGGTGLSARAEVIYHSSFQSGRMTDDQANDGAEPYVHTSDKVLGNLSATFSFADGRYAITGYVRNITDTRYKTLTGLQTTAPGQFISTVDLSDPRTWGINATARF